MLVYIEIKCPPSRPPGIAENPYKLLNNNIRPIKPKLYIFYNPNPVICQSCLPYC